jgi:hypothetical protein
MDGLKDEKNKKNKLRPFSRPLRINIFIGNAFCRFASISKLSGCCWCFFLVFQLSKSTQKTFLKARDKNVKEIFIFFKFIALHYDCVFFNSFFFVVLNIVGVFCFIDSIHLFNCAGRHLIIYDGK